MAALEEITAHLDATLDIANIPDYPQAINGLQLANRGEISRVAAAVDFSGTTVNAAARVGAQLLLVHHGMFWSGQQPITGARFARLRALIEHDIAVYSAHLPLDVHPVLGNNAQLASCLGLVPDGGFARFQSIDVGLRGQAEIPTRTVIDRSSAFARQHGGTVVATPCEPDRITRRWGMCTGAGASSATIAEAVERGIDTLIVGEGPHHTAVEARDLGLVIVYAGHYATETLGVRALAAAIAERFHIESSFIDAPTGL